MHFSKGLVTTLCAFALLAVAYYLSRPAYPKISPKAYEYATALYAACNQHRPEKLDVLTELIERSDADREITARESRWLLAIIEQARSGKWDAAVAECRVLLECQVDKDVALAIESNDIQRISRSEWSASGSLVAKGSP